MVPKLRFREFDGAWREKKIEEIFSSIAGGGTPSKDDSYWAGNIPWISSSDVSEDSITGIDVTRFISESAIKNSATKLIPRDSVLVVSRVGVGKVAISKFELCTSQDFTNLIGCKGNPYFYAYLLGHYMKRKASSVQGTAIKGLPSTEIKGYSVFAPDLGEQQKIADFFSTLDKKIELNERKLEALKKLKKGVIQKIFKQEIRFKNDDGTEFPKWEIKKIIDVARLYNGRAYKQEELVECGKYQVLRVGNFFTNNQFFYSDLELEPNKYANNGDLLYCWSASFGPKIWRGDKVIYHYHIWKIEPFDVEKLYLYYYLQNEVSALEKEMNGGTMLHLTKSNIENGSIYLPSFEEQIKIAKFLSSLDSKIALTENSLELFKKVKIGFMQQMFV